MVCSSKSARLKEVCSVQCRLQAQLPTVAPSIFADNYLRQLASVHSDTTTPVNPSEGAKANLKVQRFA